jgi:opacity protein-like surface antigen
MSIFSSRSGLVLFVAALCLGGPAAHAQAVSAQAAPISYWIPGSPFGGNLAGGQGLNTYGNFPSFDGGDSRFANMRYNFPNGWFVGSEGGGLGLGMTGLNQAGGFGNVSSLYYQGVQFGYNFRDASGSGLPVTLYAGFDTLKYDAGSGGPFAPFDNTSSGTLPGYSAHAGVEFRPTSNLSLSVGVGFTQQPGLR